MRKIISISILLSLLICGCNKSDNTVNSELQKSKVIPEEIDNTNSKSSSVEVEPSNPFFSEYQTPFGFPPFDKIRDEHFEPAFARAIEESRNEVLAITNNSKPATFENTIVALEYSGKLLTKVSNVFFNLTSANTNERLNVISKNVEPKLSKLDDEINFTAKLFQRVKSVYDNRQKFNLSTSQLKLLDDRYRKFVRGGVGLTKEKQHKLANINAKLSTLSISFKENVLAETNDFELVIEDKNDLAGLPKSLITTAASEAIKKGKPGKWIFTTQRSSKTPFLKFSEKRKLREKMWKAYTHRGDNNNANDNKKIVSKIALLRAKKAQLLGYKTYADYRLEINTAKNPENVYELISSIWTASLAKAKEELADMQAMVDKTGGNYQVEAWDWRYLAEKIRKQRFNIDETETKPYFSLNNTLKGVFYTVNQLYGLTFKERVDLPVYDPEVRVFQVYYKNGQTIGLYILDPYVRESKRGGAWKSVYRRQQVTEDGNFIKPIIVNVLNFPKPIDKGQPTLLTFDQASSLFHEFGHASQDFLSNGIYPSQTGTLVPRDFVELPSQLLENWMLEPEVLKHFAKHYQTGKVIPQVLVDKIKNAAKFGQGFATTEYMAATMLDLAWHSQTRLKELDTNQFEKKVLSDLGLIRQIAPRYRSTYFSHIFSGGYAAGYYGYIWSEILAADAFHAFKENGIFDQATAEAFRANILSKGGSDDPMKLYEGFRGKEPEVNYLLQSRGLFH